MKDRIRCGLRMVLLVISVLAAQRCGAQSAASNLQDCPDGWSRVEASSQVTVGDLNQTAVEQAHNSALRLAEGKAVEEQCGVRAQSERWYAKHKDESFSFQALNINSYGWVVEKRVLQDTVVVEGRTSVKCLVRLCARCSCDDKASIDEYFTLDVSIETEHGNNQMTLHDGERFTVDVRPTSDCYLTILDITPDDEGNPVFYQLYPNARTKEQAPVSAGSTFSFPESTEDPHIALVAYLPEKRKMSKEEMCVIATKQPFLFLDPKGNGTMNDGGEFYFSQLSEELFSDLYAKIHSIRPSERIMKAVPLVVLAK